MSTSLRARLEAIGWVLTSTFGLTGLFGVDYVRNRGIPWPIEINPRYTASVEIHELFLGRSLLDDHRRACEGIDDQDEAPTVPAEPSQSVFGKLIIYAPCQLVMPECLRLRDAAPDHVAGSSIADVPWPGTSIDAGRPVMTLLVSAKNLAACQQRLFRLEKEWLSRLGIREEIPALGATSS
jgi:predicted ATP-grasp superfamily ATP-dependent carboligase